MDKFRLRVRLEKEVALRSLFHYRDKLKCLQSGSIEEILCDMMNSVKCDLETEAETVFRVTEATT